MDDADPALQFFEEGKVDLYGALGLTKEATIEEIKKAYRKQALKYHPDKQQLQTSNGTINGASSSSSSSSSSATATRFQQIGFAYSVLSSESRRKRYDTTGRTDESMFEEGMDWNAYFRELWTGEVSAKSLEAFKKKYRYSKEEKEDVLQAYETTKGNLPAIIDHVPFLSLREDRVRVEGIVESAIKEGDIKRSKKWDATRKDKKLILQAEKKEAREEGEAMEMAKELGVYDALFGNSKDTSNGKKRKGDKDTDGEEGDLAALQQIIAKRNEQRGSHIDGLIAKLEADAAKQNGKGKKTKSTKSTEFTEEPSDEQFAKVQARLDANKSKKRKT